MVASIDAGLGEGMKLPRGRKGDAECVSVADGVSGRYGRNRRDISSAWEVTMGPDLFKDRTAIVTGGARGIGLACAAKIAAGGGRVALWDRDMARARQSAASLGEAIAVPVDVTDDKSILAALATTEKELAAPDILIASAGI